MTVHDTNQRQISEDGEARRDYMLEVAIKLALAEGWYKLTHARIARETGVDRALVNYYLGNKAEFRDRVMAAAVASKVVPIVAEGLLYLNGVALHAPQTLRREAKAHIDRTGMKLPRWRRVAENGQVVHAWVAPTKAA
jgi:AcrR family transcriptional regulator